MSLKKSKIPVLVGLSGGVDSAASLHLLKQRGYNVVGVTFKLWEFSSTKARKNNLCCSIEGISAAKELCKKLECEYILRDVSEKFFDEIVQNFLQEYRRGRTPSPCILCNPQIKWKNLIALANELGIEFVATGHFARTFYSPVSIGERNLLRGADTEKDQSYFLYRLSADELSRTIFPVGHLRKSETRRIARYFNLPVSSPRESQELCFLPDGDVQNFLKRYLPEGIQSGKIVDTSGKTVGEHRGIALYTIGQRSGLGGGFSQPMYVKKIISEENTIVIGTADEILSSHFTVENLVWHRQMDEEFFCTVRIRHRHNDAPARVAVRGKRAEVFLKKPQRAIAPGQSAVFYDRFAVIGGGIIAEVID
ncbi:tRNA 2-thiouridine(34) synthase MnmA [bacterium]|nr:tRNA 2-thiouridine(34) synthase MnmA [bacterium]